MGGVEKIDQQLRILNFLHKTYKGYRKFEFRPIKLAILSAHKFFIKAHGINNAMLSNFLHNTIITKLLLIFQTCFGIIYAVISDVE